MFKRELEREYSVDDSLTCFPLVRGKEDAQVAAGTFKGNIAVFTPYAIHGPEVSMCVCVVCFIFLFVS